MSAASLLKAIGALASKRSSQGHLLSGSKFWCGFGYNDLFVEQWTL